LKVKEKHKTTTKKLASDKNMCGSGPNVSEAGGRAMIIGSTGFIGQFVAEASLDSGRPTYLLVQSSQASPSKASTIKSLQDKGAIIIYVIKHLYTLHLYIYACMSLLSPFYEGSFFSFLFLLLLLLYLLVDFLSYFQYIKKKKTLFFIFWAYIGFLWKCVQDDDLIYIYMGA